MIGFIVVFDLPKPLSTVIVQEPATGTVSVALYFPFDEPADASARIVRAPLVASTRP
jgi:hypothetical protein